MRKSVMYRTIVTALVMALGCAPLATEASAAEHDEGGIILVRGGGGHGGHGGFGGSHFGGSHFGGRQFARGFHDHRHGNYGDDYLGIPYWDDGQCWQSERVYTHTGWHTDRMWVCS